MASAIDPRYQALVLLAVFGSLRWGELAALRIAAQISLFGFGREVARTAGARL